jgi:hypothetical protein
MAPVKLRISQIRIAKVSAVEGESRHIHTMQITPCQVGVCRAHTTIAASHRRRSGRVPLIVTAAGGTPHRATVLRPVRPVRSRMRSRHTEWADHHVHSPSAWRPPP